MNTKNSRQAHWANQLVLLTGLLFCMVSVQAQTPAPVTLRSDVHKPLAAAQEALKNNQPDQALNLTRQALAVAQLTPAERAVVLRTQAVVALRAQNWDVAIESLEFLVASPEVPVADRLPMLESLMNAGQQKKDNARVVKWARQYIESGGSKPVIRVVMIQTLSVMGEHQQVVAEMLEKLRLDASAGVKTPEQELRMLAVSYRQLKDNAGYQMTLRRLLELYPSKAYWAEVIQRLAQQVNLNPRLELDLYRLLDQTDNLEEAGDYTEMAQLALQSSERERRADEAEREVDERYRSAWMEKHVGDEFDGVVSGVTNFGLFVELAGSKVNGLVHVTQLPHDYYHFDPLRRSLAGERTGLKFRLGDPVRVLVLKASVEDKRIDFRLVVPEGAPKKKKKAGSH